MLILNSLDISPLLRAQKVLHQALDFAHHNLQDDIARDACIQRFEFTFELAWKTLKRILDYKGLTAVSPRDVFRHAARQKLIADPLLWFRFLEQRNKTSHTYNENTAKAIFLALPDFTQALDSMILTIKKL